MFYCFDNAVLFGIMTYIWLIVQSMHYWWRILRKGCYTVCITFRWTLLSNPVGMWTNLSYCELQWVLFTSGESASGWPTRTIGTSSKFGLHACRRGVRTVASLPVLHWVLSWVSNVSNPGDNIVVTCLELTSSQLFWRGNKAKLLKL